MEDVIRDCPCHSGQRYAACCAPYHRNEREPPTPEALMRSRYAAFALGLGPYLVRTLATTHPDLAAPRQELERTLSRAKERQRFTGLRVLHSALSENHGEVLFFARIFERGQDRSFAELSDFTREENAWRYASGILLPRAALPVEIDALTPVSFLALAASLATPAPGRC
ncbi:MAG TPA: YchJ family metal-binding protein [Polyangiaceae bacterium]|nr:YchJ family metal-binding protein [Polyangiaceae bacterium]